MRWYFYKSFNEIRQSLIILLNNRFHSDNVRLVVRWYYITGYLLPSLRVTRELIIIKGPLKRVWNREVFTLVYNLRFQLRL